MNTYDYIKFNQYESGGESDELIIFAPKSRDLINWAGIPKKGWRVRMLFQRWITPNRENELTRFWKRASSPDPNSSQDYILSPTSIVVAIQGEPQFDENNKLILNHDSKLDINKSDEENLKALAEAIFDQIHVRLNESDQ